MVYILLYNPAVKCTQYKLNTMNHKHLIIIIIHFLNQRIHYILGCTSTTLYNTQSATCLQAFFFFFLQVMQNIGDGGRPQKNLCPVFTFKIVTVSINRTSIHSIKHQEIKISHKFRPDIKQCAHIITQLCKE